MREALYFSLIHHYGNRKLSILMKMTLIEDVWGTNRCVEIYNMTVYHYICIYCNDFIDLYTNASHLIFRCFHSNKNFSSHDFSGTPIGIREIWTPIYGSAALAEIVVRAANEEGWILTGSSFIFIENTQHALPMMNGFLASSFQSYSSSVHY